MHIIDYDLIETWEPIIASAMTDIFPSELIERASNSKPEYLEDALMPFENYLGPERLAIELHARFSDCGIRVYHGTRVGSSELKSIKDHGLRSLILEDRRETLSGIFSRHPDWAAKSQLLERQLELFGRHSKAGFREDGFVHACFSRNALLNECNHYLAYGAEVDDHIAHSLFPDGSGRELLRQNRDAKIISLVVPFIDAVHAANPYGFSGSIPKPTQLFVRAWAYRLSHPKYHPSMDSCCLAVRLAGPIPSDRFAEIIDISDSELFG